MLSDIEKNINSSNNRKSGTSGFIVSTNLFLVINHLFFLSQIIQLLIFFRFFLCVSVSVCVCVCVHT